MWFAKSKDAATANLTGFVLDTGHNNEVSGNTANGNSAHGFEAAVTSVSNRLCRKCRNGEWWSRLYVVLGGSSGNTFGGNKAVGNVLEGFNVDASSSNEFTRNTADRNLVGFWVGNGSAANGSDQEQRTP